ncbi:MAG: hypothetical protein VKL39_20420 [Leptolyngbyaceae bacterium]|nr:hypothetical protein [Leptolyngbyaceae bacterium]
MNLPLVLDLAIGLIFFYLILSLLASEFQELITTLLQWRAEHLKKSIEILFSGEEAEEHPGTELANRLYNHPLIAALNQEAKGPFAHFFRLISHRIGRTYRFITRTRNIFGDARTSGPSYIPSHAFSSAMLDDLGVKEAVMERSVETFNSFIDEKLKLVAKLLDELRNESGDQSLLDKLHDESIELAERLKAYRYDLEYRRVPFSAALKMAAEDLEQFVLSIDSVLGGNPTYENILKARLPFIKQAIAILKSEPTISEIIEGVLTKFETSDRRLPKQLRDNLKLLANKAQEKAQTLADSVDRLEDEVSDWFDRAMDRSAGVYKRNAKGIAVIIGFLVAVAANADTTYIVDRLSRDTLLRTTITQAANQIAEQPLGSIPRSEDGTLQPESIEAIQDAVNRSLDRLPLPIGWTPVVIEGQNAQAEGWTFPILRRIIGWLITGIAISMGSSFWYGILSRVIDVKNIGNTSRDKNTKSSTEK